MTEYNIFTAESPDALEALVTEALEQDWELQGGVAVGCFQDGDIYFYQAMFRKVDIDN